MKITKYSHACVRIEWQDRVLVVDPGVWSEPEALHGADAVLVTHEHADHVDLLRLVGAGLPVFVPDGFQPADEDAVGRLDLTVVSSGQVFSAAGFEITATGGRHAVVYGEFPECANLGYVVDGRFYHPGDSVHPPELDVEVLCVPLHAPWLKPQEAVDFIKAVRPAQAIGIHEAMLNERGVAVVNRLLSTVTDSGYRYLHPGESMVIDRL